MHKWAGLMFLVALAWGCASSTTGDQGSGVLVEGSVSDAFNRTPINGVDICILEPNELGCVRSNFRGEFSFRNVTPGSRLLIQFIAPSYYPTVAHYTVGESNEFLTYLLTSDELANLASSLAGVTRDESKGTLIFAARTGKGPDATNVEEVSLVMEPDNGEGPFYAVQNGFDMSRSSTTSVGGGAWFNIDQGTYTVRYNHPNATCIPYYGWASGETNALTVRIKPGFISYINQICNP